MYSLVFLLLSKLCFAETTYSFDSYLYGQKFQVADSIINVSNQILKAPYQQLSLDLRGEWKWREGKDLILIRPRVAVSVKSAEFGVGVNEQRTVSSADLTDAFYEHYWDAKWATTVGLQVYQWGPAEFFNSSNPFYHFNSDQKSLMYKEKGQVLLRMNYSADKNNSLVFAVEPVSNNAPEWIAEDSFIPKFAVKYEKSWANTANYAGVVVGSQEKSNLFLGEYFSYSFIDGLSVYGDIKHSQKQPNYIPVASGISYNLVESPEENPSPTFGVFGVRWEDNYDIRFEYIYNGAGFDREQLNRAVFAASDVFNPDYIRNITRFQKIGLELLGRNYLYVSYRVADPFKFKEFNFSTRIVQSLQDSSSLTQVEVDKSVFESFQLFSIFGYVSGDLDTEFRLINDWQLLAGIKWGI